jgi:hypothetical protein
LAMSTIFGLSFVCFLLYFSENSRHVSIKNVCSLLIKADCVAEAAS